MKRRIWLRTNDPDVLVCIPDYDDGEITIIDRHAHDLVAAYNPPDCAEFDKSPLRWTIPKDIRDEVTRAIESWSVFYPEVTVDFDRIVVTFTH